MRVRWVINIYLSTFGTRSNCADLAQDQMANDHEFNHLLNRVCNYVSVIKSLTNNVLRGICSLRIKKRSNMTQRFSI